MTKSEQVYGGSLYELAKEEGKEETIYTQLQQVMQLMEENPDYGRLLQNVSISKQERCAVLEEAFGGRIEPYLLNFMKILCENAMMGQLKGCAGEFRRRYNEDHDIVEVCAVTAVEMSQAIREKLRDKLQQILGKTVELRCRIDPGCMGGVLLELPGRQLDGTVKHRLDALGASIRTVAL